MNFEIKTGKYEEKCKEQLKEQISSHIFSNWEQNLKMYGQQGKEVKAVQKCRKVL